MEIEHCAVSGIYFGVIIFWVLNPLLAYSIPIPYLINVWNEYVIVIDFHLGKPSFKFLALVTTQKILD